MANNAQPKRDHDKTLEDTFPASDPPASSGITGAGETDQPARQENTEAQPTGTPTSDRYGTETAHQGDPGKQSGGE